MGEGCLLVITNGRMVTNAKGNSIKKLPLKD